MAEKSKGVHNIYKHNITASPFRPLFRLIKSGQQVLSWAYCSQSKLSKMTAMLRISHNLNLFIKTEETCIKSTFNI